jgi:hypothetical protein
MSASAKGRSLKKHWQELRNCEDQWGTRWHHRNASSPVGEALLCKALRTASACAWVRTKSQGKMWPSHFSLVLLVMHMGLLSENCDEMAGQWKNYFNICFGRPYFHCRRHTVNPSLPNGMSNNSENPLSPQIKCWHQVPKKKWLAT